MGGFLFTLKLIVLSWASFASLQISTADQRIELARLLDLYIRDYTFNSFNTHFKTGTLHNINLPANFSGIKVDTVKYRCGSLRRYGAKIKQFHLQIGVTVHPCVERVMIVAQNLASNWSSVYYSNYDLSGYQLVSPILGLLAYNAGSDLNFSNNPFELGIQAHEKQPITIDFSNVTKIGNMSGISLLCASFEGNGKVTLAKQASNFICVVTRNGHFGLVVKAGPPPVLLQRRESRWKVAVGTSIGAVLGAFLLGLLLVAMLVRVKKKSRMVELERRAYEEEALQVSMVGHVRAPMALVTRTTPTIEHHFVPPRAC